MNTGATRRRACRRPRYRPLTAALVSGLVVVALAACAVPRAATTRLDDVTTTRGDAARDPGGRAGHGPPSDTGGSLRERQVCTDRKSVV